MTNFLDEIKVDDLFIGSDEINDDIKEFDIPMEWCVKATYPVKARNLKEAIDWVKENAHLIKLSPDPEYVEDSFKLYDIDSFDNEEGYLAYIEDLYGSEGYPEGYTSSDVYTEFLDEWHKEHNVNLVINGKEENIEVFPPSYIEFMSDYFLDYVNEDLK